MIGIKELEDNNDLRMAYGLTMFALKSLSDAERTKIGVKSKGDATVIGFQRYIRETPVDVLTLKDLPIEHNKLKGKWELVDRYSEELGLRTNKQLTISRLEDFNNNKLIPVPIKMGTGIKFFQEMDTDVKQKVIGEVSGMEYCLDKDTLKFEYKLIIKSEREKPMAKMKVTGINRDVFIQSYDQKSQLEENGKNVIEFTRFGTVKPIRLVKKGIEYIIDNSFVMANGKIIGRFAKDDFSEEHTKNLKGLIDKKVYIKNFIPYMLPYGLGDYNDITSGK